MFLFHELLIGGHDVGALDYYVGDIIIEPSICLPALLFFAILVSGLKVEATLTIAVIAIITTFILVVVVSCGVYCYIVGI